MLVQATIISHNTSWQTCLMLPCASTVHSHRCSPSDPLTAQQNHRTRLLKALQRLLISLRVKMQSVSMAFKAICDLHLLPLSPLLLLCAPCLSYPSPLASLPSTPLPQGLGPVVPSAFTALFPGQEESLGHSLTSCRSSFKSHHHSEGILTIHPCISDPLALHFFFPQYWSPANVLDILLINFCWLSVSLWSKVSSMRAEIFVCCFTSILQTHKIAPATLNNDLLTERWLRLYVYSCGFLTEVWAPEGHWLRGSRLCLQSLERSEDSNKPSMMGVNEGISLLYSSLT